jgi:NDP-sugar pyrophosphorylase family protein
LVLLRNSLRERFSVVNTKGGLITGFGGMPDPARDDEPPLMFTGIQILEPEIFEYIPHGLFSHTTTDVYPQAIARGERIAAHVATGKWRELSTLQRYLDISLEMLRERGETVSVGAATVIAEPVNVRDAVIWDKVTVEAGARVERAIIADNVRLRPDDLIVDAVVVPRSLIEGKVRPEKGLQGRVEGENFVVPLSG